LLRDHKNPAPAVSIISWIPATTCMTRYVQPTGRKIRNAQNRVESSKKTEQKSSNRARRKQVRIYKSYDRRKRTIYSRRSNHGPGGYRRISHQFSLHRLTLVSHWRPSLTAECSTALPSTISAMISVASGTSAPPPPPTGSRQAHRPRISVDMAQPILLSRPFTDRPGYASITLHVSLAS
jgi:hypothetical protein